MNGLPFYDEFLKRIWSELSFDIVNIYTSAHLFSD